MARGSRRTTLAKHEFANKLLLNQWLVSQFGVDPLADGYARGERPFHKLAEHLRVTREGLDADGYHHFYHELAAGDFFRPGQAKVTGADLLRYEQNIVGYTTGAAGGELGDFLYTLEIQKIQKEDGPEYDFKKDAPVPSVQNAVPEWIKDNKVVCDWYPRIQSVVSKAGGAHEGHKKRRRSVPARLRCLISPRSTSSLSGSSVSARGTIST